jgi:undecaprenyl diphosphate synthase
MWMNNNKGLPGHVAIIMDGNGRWAQQRGMPRGSGHKAGVTTLRDIVQHCIRRKIAVLTVFAFSSENWSRPRQEVDLLMELFLTSLRSEVDDLHKNNISLGFIGNRAGFPDKLQKLITLSESRTAMNTGMKLIIAANYGGRWDITRACEQIAQAVSDGRLQAMDIDEDLVRSHLSLTDLPDPDLFIRTGGEQRISNYLLWHCAYTELYFTDLLWPDFSPAEFDNALVWYEGRQRRFGRIDEQDGS